MNKINSLMSIINLSSKYSYNSLKYLILKFYKFIKYAFSKKHKKIKFFLLFMSTVLFTATILPFLLFSHLEYNWYLANIIGAIICGMSTFIYFYYQFRINSKLSLLSPLMIFLVMNIFNLDMKTEIKSEIPYLHPALKQSLQISKILGFNPVITDISRKKDFYIQNNLKINHQSKHYVQDNISFAVDIRTKNSHLIRNYLLKYYFELLGFNALIHKGTEEHLHVDIF